MARQVMNRNKRYIETSRKSQSASLKAAWNIERKFQARQAIIDSFRK